MAAREAAFIKIQWNAQGAKALLAYIVCEWVLIILLFIDASLAYFVTKFAHICKLQAPCLLCTRLDHILGEEEPGFYWSLICSNHRSEVSSLINCQLHGKLADGYNMCEDCLLSYTAKNKPNPDMHRLLAGKLGPGHGGYGFPSAFMNKDFIPGSVSTKSCSCCNKSWRSRHSSQRLFQLRTPAVKPNIPLPPNRQPNDDDDNGNSIVRDRIEVKEDVAVPSASETQPQVLDSFEKRVVKDPIYAKSSAPGASAGRGLKYQDLHTDRQKAKPISSDDTPSSSRVVEVAPSEPVSRPRTPPSVGASPKKSEDATEVTSVGHVSVPEHKEVKNSISATIEEDSGANDVHKAVASGERRGGFGFASEKSSTKDRVDGVNNGSELHSSAQRTDLSLNHTNPQVDHQSDGSSSHETRMSQNSRSIERAEESGSKGLNRSVSNESESENVEDLKRQIDEYQNRLTDLYEELEEERNASTIAANETMAMIRRLQEEKAALNMEVMQYLRMMEEQAEHDADDLERANDLLAEREKDIQDLEAELEFYRYNFPEEPMAENMSDGNLTVARAGNMTMSIEFRKGRNDPAVEISWLEFKDDKLYISQRLTSLENNLQEIFLEGDDKYSRKEEEELPPQNESHLSNGRPSDEDESNASVNDDPLDGIRQKDLMKRNEVGRVVALENEISDLKDRLKTLESNRDFLERALISLQNGKEGLQLVEEIVHQLQELLNIGIRIRSNPIQ